MWVMGLDMGTTGSKAVIFDDKWNVVSSAYRTYDLSFPGRNFLELDAEMVWDRIVEVVKEANSMACGGKVGALAISAIGDVIIPVDISGKQLRPAIVDFDVRGSEEIREFSNAFGTRRLFGITGMPPLYLNSLPKILWYRENEPETFGKVGRWATFEDYILQKMGMKPVASYSIAARTMLFDIRKKLWAGEVLEAAGIEPDKLPGLAPSGIVIGELGCDMAEKLGFEAGVKVCSGGHDMVCAAVGAGLTPDDSGTAVDIDGTIEGIVVAMKEANTGEMMLENLFPCYPGYDGYVTFSVNLTAGCVLKWLKEELSRELEAEASKQGKNVYELMLENIDASRPGNLIFIPQYSGSGNPYFDPKAKGLIYGMTLDSTRNDIVKGLLEGLCYEVNMQMEGFERAGIKLDKLLCVGGGSRSGAKLQLKANITGHEMLSVSVSEASALGAAAMAAKAVGMVDNPVEAVRKGISVQKAYKPSGGRNEFAGSYLVYKALHEIKHKFENSY